VEGHDGVGLLGFFALAHRLVLPESLVLAA
jgi:hypothetical protein